MGDDVEVSIIVPIKNGEAFLDELFESIVAQTALRHLSIEVVLYNDCSTDGTAGMITQWVPRLQEAGLRTTASHNTDGHSGGVGCAKNRAVALSRGRFLCFQDADDIMKNERIEKQHAAAQHLQWSIVGSRFERWPPGSTGRYAEWLNSLGPESVYTQRFRECPVAMPTWFCHRQVFDRVGGFTKDAERAAPEDLIFLYQHLRQGGGLHVVDQCLLTYRYHPECTSFRVDARDIWDVRVREFELCVLDHWRAFGIWNVGREGKRLLRSLSLNNRRKVHAFYDVDPVKLARVVYVDKDDNNRRIPILHWTALRAMTRTRPPSSPSAEPPPLVTPEGKVNVGALKLVTCVKYMLTGRYGSAASSGEPIGMPQAGMG
mmetsp:Transcript_24560/g.60700  ORF Transcript_24560/g.60700 Transcript_24560/m.60700 type:complete len:374 (-) Transcript_24560:40-1161(-)